MENQTNLHEKGRGQRVKKFFFYFSFNFLNFIFEKFQNKRNKILKAIQKEKNKMGESLISNEM